MEIVVNEEPGLQGGADNTDISWYHSGPGYEPPPTAYSSTSEPAASTRQPWFMTSMATFRRPS